MKALIVALALAIGMAGSASAEEVDIALLKEPIGIFIDAFNEGLSTGSMEVSTVAYAAGDISILNETAPYVWSGAEAPKNWGIAVLADIKRLGLTQVELSVGDPTRYIVDGARAYVVVPATWRYVEAGKAMRESALVAFALQQQSVGWRIAGWSWSGTPPEADPDFQPAASTAPPATAAQ